MENIKFMLKQKSDIASYQFLTIIDTLQILFLSHFRFVLALKPGLNGFVLSIEIAHVWHKILHNIHMRQRMDFHSFVQICVNLADSLKIP